MSANGYDRLEGAIKGSRAFHKAMLDAAAAAEQMDERSAEQTKALQSLTVEMRGLKDAVAGQTQVIAAAIAEAMKANGEAMAKALQRISDRPDPDDAKVIAALGKLSADIRAIKPANVSIPQAKDRTDEILAGLTKVSQCVDTVREALMKPVLLDYDNTGEPWRAVRKDKK
jgi:hypothetical protein